MLRSVRILAAAAAFALLGPTLFVIAAHAADTIAVTAPANVTAVADTGFWATTIQPFATSILSGVATIAIGFAAAAVQRYTGVMVAQKYKDLLHSAAMTGVNKGLAELGPRVDGIVTSSDKSSIIGKGVQWVQASVPNAVRKLGVTPQVVEGLVTSKLGEILNSKATVSTAASASSARAG